MNAYDLSFDDLAERLAAWGEPAYRVRRMFTPPRGEGAELLNGSPAAVAQRILELVRERLA